MTSRPTHKPLPFHPHELAICGLQDQERTVFLHKLCAEMEKQSLHVGIRRQDEGHAQEFYETSLGESGAYSQLISTTRSNYVATRDCSPRLLQSWALNLDLVLLESEAISDLPSLVLLDADLSILSMQPSPSQSQPIAYVGNWPKAPLLQLQPYFHRDDISALTPLLLATLSQRALEQPLYGLVTAGGRSQRMGEDKALCQYHSGESQLNYCVKLLNRFCQETFLSVREDQTQSEPYQSYQQISDSFLKLGPLGGILSAMRTHPNTAFLVLAIDMPAVNEDVIATLLKNRNPFRFATAYQSLAGDFPEPLCTIYEAKSYARMLSELAFGLHCPTSFLKNSRIQKVEPLTHENRLLNVNSPEDKQYYLGLRNYP